MRTSPYDDPGLASTFARLSGPRQFEAPAQDLIDELRLPAGAVVLDVGTGTGIVARAALAAVGPSGRVIGIDPSLEMLGASAAADRYARAVAAVPGLPFPDQTFDAVVAGFVVTHVRDDRGAIADMARVCRIAGPVAFSTWGSLASEATRLWDSIVDRYFDRAEFQRIFASHIPWESRFADAGNLLHALEAAGLRAVRVETREYRVPLTVGEFLTIRRHGVQGQILRTHLDVERWDQMWRELRHRFGVTFGERFVWIRDVHIGVGRRA